MIYIYKNKEYTLTELARNTDLTWEAMKNLEVKIKVDYDKMKNGVPYICIKTINGIEIYDADELKNRLNELESYWYKPNDENFVCNISEVLSNYRYFKSDEQFLDWIFDNYIILEESTEMTDGYLINNFEYYSCPGDLLYENQKYYCAYMIELMENDWTITPDSFYTWITSNYEVQCVHEIDEKDWDY